MKTSKFVNKIKKIKKKWSRPVVVGADDINANKEFANYLIQIITFMPRPIIVSQI